MSVGRKRPQVMQYLKKKRRRNGTMDSDMVYNEEQPRKAGTEGNVSKRSRYQLKRSLHTGNCLSNSDNEELWDCRGELNGDSDYLDIK